ncbi:nucleoside/nucleotide kinase family protein [Nocardioides sp. GCM10027113]|uniref:nucleoside/nucleotide kinase family protein n=1 Tax=unclassified Nocardioides TaxID=2615069 RepID=UPI00361E354A
MTVSTDGRELADLLDGLVGEPVGGDPAGPADRVLLGISGAPGSGKSTLAAALAALRPEAAVVPLDGFHLADVELARRGLLDRKGAPESFDGHGYAALLTRLRERPDHVVMAPGFERDLEQPLAGALPVPPSAGLVVTEGNYLLLDADPWPQARARLDAVWHVVVDDALRRTRLVARHEAFGKPPAAARAWVDRVDEPNARLVEAARDRADLVLDLTGWRPVGG